MRLNRFNQSVILVTILAVAGCKNNPVDRLLGISHDSDPANPVAASSPISVTAATTDKLVVVPPNPPTNNTPERFIIMDYYQVLLGRAPDSAGLKYWLDQHKDGMTTDQIWVGLLNSPEFQAKPNSSPEKLICTYYRVLLVRDPEPAGFKFWMSQFKGGATADSVWVGLLASQEFQTKPNTFPQKILYGFYWDLLNRNPDFAGFQYWMNAYNSGMTMDQIKQGIMNSPEYQFR